MRENGVVEIRKAVRHNKKMAEVERQQEGRGRTLAYDSSIHSFAGSFITLIPEHELSEEYLHGGALGEVFRTYIEQTLGNGKERGLTAVEFGGPGSALFKGFTKDFFRKTAGVCLKDVRSNTEKKYEGANHSVIPGNITDVFDHKLLQKIAIELDTEKIDLIVSRMAGPVAIIQKNPAILERIMGQWYKLLAENGLMFIQFGRGSHTQILIEKWADAVNKKLPAISVEVGDGILRLHKKIGAPEELPPAKELFL